MITITYASDGTKICKINTDRKGSRREQWLAMKRSQQVGVRCSPEDLELFQRAGKVLAPEVPLTLSTIVLVLARKGAETVVAGSKSKRKKEG